MSFLQRQAGRFQMASGTKLDKHAVQKAALTQLCHMLLNTSEFLYAE